MQNCSALYLLIEPKSLLNYLIFHLGKYDEAVQISKIMNVDLLELLISESYNSLIQNSVLNKIASIKNNGKNNISLKLLSWLTDKVRTMQELMIFSSKDILLLPLMLIVKKELHLESNISNLTAKVKNLLEFVEGMIENLSESNKKNNIQSSFLKTIQNELKELYVLYSNELFSSKRDSLDNKKRIVRMPKAWIEPKNQLKFDNNDMKTKFTKITKTKFYCQEKQWEGQELKKSYKEEISKNLFNDIEITGAGKSHVINFKQISSEFRKFLDNHTKLSNSMANDAHQNKHISMNSNEKHQESRKNCVEKFLPQPSSYIKNIILNKKRGSILKSAPGPENTNIFQERKSSLNVEDKKTDIIKLFAAIRKEQDDKMNKIVSWLVSQKKYEEAFNYAISQVFKLINHISYSIFRIVILIISKN